MRVRALDALGDWTYGKGRNNYKTGLLAVSQNIQTRLLSFLGDCFFSLDSGIDWFNLLGSKNQLAINLAVSKEILNTQDVTGLIQLGIDLDVNRNLTITYQVQTTYSRIIRGNFIYDLGTIGNTGVKQDA